MDPFDLVARCALSAIFKRLRLMASEALDLAAKIALSDATDEVLESAAKLDRQDSDEIEAKIAAATAAVMPSRGEAPHTVLH